MVLSVFPFLTEVVRTVTSVQGLVEAKGRVSWTKFSI